jgi:dihydrofolate reductase
MSIVVMQASVSLDGFIADPSDDVGPLFDWYRNGDVEFTGADPRQVFHVSQASAECLRAAWANIGASVIGRHMFGLTNGWDGKPPVAEAEIVVTHEASPDWNDPEAPFTFVTDGVDCPVEQAKAFAGDKDVSVSPGNIGGQALAAGLVDEVRADLVPVFFGAGVRFFGDYCYTCGPLDADIDVAGQAAAELSVRSSLPPADLFTRLCDVAPRGKPRNVCDGIARRSPGATKPQPDGTHHVRIDLWPTAYRFKKGPPAPAAGVQLLPPAVRPQPRLR